MRWLVAVVFAMMPVAALAGEPAGARAFMERAIDFAAHDYRDPHAKAYRSFFADRLDRAIMLDSSDGEIGVIEAEVICACQDVAGPMRVVVVTGDDKAALATVKRVGSIGRFRLVRQNGLWKIADISEKVRPSLQAALNVSNTEVLKERAKAKKR